VNESQRPVKKLFKKIITATLILFIVLSIAGIIYVVRFKEEMPAVTETKKAVKKAAGKATGREDRKKSATTKPLSLREIAIIIDDIGYDLSAAEALMKIDADLTFSVLPNQTYSRKAAEMLHKAKKETLLHLPMEPVAYPREKPGEGALFTDMSEEEITLQLKKNIAAVPYISGVNNHMGSKFMTDEQKLVTVFKELKNKNLFFVDSKTSTDTRTVSAARKTGVKIAERQVFIDNDRDYRKIYDRLIKLAEDDDGFPKIVIGHPYPETIRALQDAVRVFRKQGISIVPVSHIIKKEKRSPEGS